MRPLTDFDAVVDDDHIRPLMELIAAHRLQKGEAHALLRRRWAGVDVKNGQAGMRPQLRGKQAVLGRDEQTAIADLLAHGDPIEVGFREQQHGVGRQPLHELTGRLQQRDGLRRKRHYMPKTRVGPR